MRRKSLPIQRVPKPKYEYSAIASRTTKKVSSRACSCKWLPVLEIATWHTRLTTTVLAPKKLALVWNEDSPLASDDQAYRVQLGFVLSMQLWQITLYSTHRERALCRGEWKDTSSSMSGSHSSSNLAQKMRFARISSFSTEGAAPPHERDLSTRPEPIQALIHWRIQQPMSPQRGCQDKHAIK